MARRKGGRRPQPSQPDGKVVVAYLHPGQVEADFHTSLIDLWMWDLTHEQRIIIGGGHLAMRSGANISGARNKVVRNFLDEHTAEWLLWIDSDMVFPPDSLDRLVAAADSDERPIVGGLCFGLWLGSGTPEIFPTIYWWDDDNDDPGVVRANNYPDNTVFPVGGTGSAFILIHRRVLEAMRERYPEPFPWYQEAVLTGRPVAEDMTFCLRAVTAGFPIAVHTGVKVGHVKPQIIDEAAFQAQQAAQ